MSLEVNETEGVGPMSDSKSTRSFKEELYEKLDGFDARFPAAESAINYVPDHIRERIRKKQKKGGKEEWDREKSLADRDRNERRR